MILIFEGPERSGKGTQSMIFRDMFAIRRMPVHYLYYPKFNIAAENYSGYASNEFRSMFRLMTMAVENKMNLILDRAHLSEWVYGQIYRKYIPDFIWDHEQQYLENDLAMKNTYLVTFYAAPETLINRDDGLSFTTSLDKETALTNKQLELDLYSDCFERTKFRNKIRLNSDCNTISLLTGRIKEFVGM